MHALHWGRSHWGCIVEHQVCPGVLKEFWGGGGGVFWYAPATQHCLIWLTIILQSLSPIFNRNCQGPTPRTFHMQHICPPQTYGYFCKRTGALSIRAGDLGLTNHRDYPSTSWENWSSTIPKNASHLLKICIRLCLDVLTLYNRELHIFKCGLLIRGFHLGDYQQQACVSLAMQHISWWRRSPLSEAGWYNYKHHIPPEGKFSGEGI